MNLRKDLGLVDVFCLAAGAMISSGLFILPGLAHARAGPSVVVSYFLAGLLAGMGLLSTAELATAMPKSGGDYFFIARGMGSAVGTIAGVLNWFALSLKSAFALVGIAAFAKLMFTIDPRLVGIGLCAAFVGLNLFGVKEAARFQVVLVFGLLGILLLYIVMGLPAVRVQNFSPFAPHGLRSVFSTAGFVFVSYGGLLQIASVSEEVRNPGRTIPMGMLLSLVVVVAFYTLMVFIASGVLGAGNLDHSLTPISDSAFVFMGGGGKVLLGIAAMMAFLTTANAGIMAASRYLLAMSHDGLLPSPLQRVGRRFRTPYISVVVTGVIVALAFFVKLDILVEAASTVLIVSYILSSLSIIVLRESRVQNYRPKFHSPFYPWVQIIAIIGFTFVLFEMGEEAFLISSLLVISGFSVYWFFGRARDRNESAILHLIQRITAKELVTGLLEAELKEIIRSRDEIVLDRFDRIIEDSIVLDLDGAVSSTEFFGLVSRKMSERFEMEASDLLEAFLKSESENSSVLNGDVAIPHIIIEGKHLFDILLARSRDGIVLSENEPPVHSIFILAGTKDDRNFHLRALAAIAQIVQDPRFMDKWIHAPNKQGLRDAVLLGERKRSAGGDAETSSA